MKCTDPLPVRSRADMPRRTLAPRMTGIGCYGPPRRIVQTLTRAVARFGLTSSDMLTVAWQSDPHRTARDRRGPEGQRRMLGAEAVVMLSQYGRVAGFFLSATDGRPRLHVHIRSTRKRSGPSAG